MPEGLCTEVRDIVQEVVIKTIPKKKKSKKAKLLSEEALQTGEKRREAKGKGEKERYPSECNCIGHGVTKGRTRLSNFHFKEEQGDIGKPSSAISAKQ